MQSQLELKLELELESLWSPWSMGYLRKCISICPAGTAVWHAEANVANANAS